MSESGPTKGNYIKVAYKDLSGSLKALSRHEEKRSWKAPATMLCALVLGLAIALAQHFTYTALDGKPVATVSVSQSWISRISTGLAFAVKVALTICVGAAYVQHQWLRLRQTSFKVDDFDKLTGVLGNLFCFFESTVWCRYPMLALMAIVSWIIPLSAIVTPGALSVQPVRLVQSFPMQVPQPLYDYTNYGIFSDIDYVFSESSRLTKLLAYTASSRSPVPLQPQYPNQTYNLVFDGPALKCSSANETVIHDATIQYGNASGASELYTFAAWVPTWGGDDSVDVRSEDVARIFVMTNTGPASGFVNVTDGSFPPSYKMVNVTECLLHNVTYDVDFTFRYPNQTQDVRIAAELNPVSALRTDWTFGPPTPISNVSDVNSYSAVMSAFGSLLVGSSAANHYGYIANNKTRYDMVTIDWSRAEAVQSGLESLFQNFTLSLLSDSGLIKNSSQAASVSVNVETWPVTYVYSPSDLFLAYGLSLLAALICTGIGLRAFFVNNASYQNIFSTYIRATNDAGLANYVPQNDLGEDPLPKDIAEARFNVSRRSFRRIEIPSSTRRNGSAEIEDSPLAV